MRLRTILLRRPHHMDSLRLMEMFQLHTPQRTNRRHHRIIKIPHTCRQRTRCSRNTRPTIMVPRQTFTRVEVSSQHRWSEEVGRGK
jgi:hypothetical protein